MGIEVIHERCNGCKLCLKVCLYGAIEVIDKKATIGSNCNLCGLCVEACPKEAIVIEEKVGHKKEKQKLAQAKGIWVFAEVNEGKLNQTVAELLSVGKKLAADLKTELCACLLGASIESLAKDLIALGADKVYLVSSPALENIDSSVYAQVITELAQEFKPAAILAGATSTGRTLLPQIAAKLETGLTADCTSLAVDKKKGLLLQTRPAFGGNVMATIVCENAYPQMATVRPHVMPIEPSDKKKKGEIINWQPKCDLSPSTNFVKLVKDTAEKVKLEEAEIIVSGGRGLKEAKNFKLIRNLADVLGAAVGASRAAVDEGWISYSHQIGQTGKTVCPKLYIACGISGAIQHLAGMQASDVIVAINKDSRAPIFNMATYGIVGDLFEVVPHLTQKLKKELRG